jgi:hypothetical protein
VESLAKKYDERYKAAADVNTLTGSRRGKILRDSGSLCLSWKKIICLRKKFSILTDPFYFLLTGSDLNLVD